MEVTLKGSKLSLVQGDITQQVSDAIVNAANSSLLGGGGVDGAIHQAGGTQILEECRAIVARQGRLPAGQAVITSGGKLKARYVIHTVGPVWQGGDQSEATTLASAYRESLKQAEKLGLKSIAFPSISTGAYGYPVISAATIALRTVKNFLETEAKSVQDVRFVLFEARTYAVYAQALEALCFKGAP
jgi:O-acetyl-ADP-ribose deacetylase